MAEGTSVALFGNPSRNYPHSRGLELFSKTGRNAVPESSLDGVGFCSITWTNWSIQVSFPPRLSVAAVVVRALNLAFYGWQMWRARLWQQVLTESSRA